MSEQSYETMTRESLTQRWNDEKPDNADRDQGYALVNLLQAKNFAAEHIPSSINTPKGNENEFETRFSKDKEIIVCCASAECDASPTVAQELTDRGFTNVVEFEAGMQGWKQAGGEVETGTRAS